MSKKRVPTHSHSPRTVKCPRHKVKTDKGFERALKRGHFAGISLSGGKSDKTCLAFLEYYPEQNKIFLSHLSDKIKTEGEISGDLSLVEEIQRFRKPEITAINAPLNTPKCMRCKLKCPGYEACQEDEIIWMWENYRQSTDYQKRKKLFTPYTERCVEQHLAANMEENFQVQHAFGANMAPLYARAHFLSRRLDVKMIEVFPKLSLWRIGRSLNIQKSYLRFHKHSVGGEDARLAILKELVDRRIAFMYEQDVRLMVDNHNAFDAFICALTAVLKSRGQCEDRPKGFPRAEGWIEIPSQDIIW